MEQFIDFAIRNWYLFVALIAIIGLLVGTEVMRKIRGIAAINPTEAMQLINHQDALMLDIRDLNEYKEGHIPDAKNIPQSALASRLRELEKYKSKPVILYCRTGARSSSAASVLKKNGFQTVHSLGGGLSAWQTANLPIRKK